MLGAVIQSVDSAAEAAAHRVANLASACRSQKQRNHGSNSHADQHVFHRLGAGGAAGTLLRLLRVISIAVIFVHESGSPLYYSPRNIYPRSRGRLRSMKTFVLVGDRLRPRSIVFR